MPSWLFLCRALIIVCCYLPVKVKMWVLELLVLFSFRSESTLSASASMDVDAKPSAQSFRYSLNFPCIGQCIIINNKNFERRTGILFCLLLVRAMVSLWLVIICFILSYYQDVIYSNKEVNVSTLVHLLFSWCQVHGYFQQSRKSHTKI